jgi:alkylated DNA repair dioxygenase AlkB
MTSIGHDLFCGLIQVRPERIEEQSMVLREFAAIETNELLECVNDIEKAAPFLQMLTPGGFTMSVAKTNCGRLGWTTDRRGCHGVVPVKPGPHPVVGEQRINLTFRKAG